MRTSLYSRHQALGARMADFHGWEMPVWYSGIVNEHHAVRERVGIFDVSHMGEFLIEGAGAESFLNGLLTNDVANLSVGQAHYTFLCNEQGGVIDDCTLYRIRENLYMLVVNASNIAKDFSWVHSHEKGSVTVENVSDEIGLLALQGPRAAALLESVALRSFEELRYYHCMDCTMQGRHVRVSRTGYTGEDGFEIYCDAEDASMIWDAILEAGKSHEITPCALGARDTLRLEAGMALYGNDLDEDHTPLEAGLGKFVKLERQPDFIGKEALRVQKIRGVARKLIGFEMEGREIPRSSYAIHSQQGNPIGHVTSGCPSPTLKIGIGMGYVEEKFSRPGTIIQVEIRGKHSLATVRKVPFYRRKGGAQP